MDIFDLSGKTALVTGSSRGLGHVIARGLAQAGAGVVGNRRDAGRVGPAGAAGRATVLAAGMRSAWTGPLPTSGRRAWRRTPVRST